MSEYKIELHAHSAESSRCGSIAAAELVKKYKKAGYSALVLTDHYYARFFNKYQDLSWEAQLKKYLKGYNIAKREASKEGLNIFLGIEIQFNNDQNEFLIYGLDEDFLLKHPNLHQMTLEEFRTLTVDQNLLIFQAHPFRPGMSPANDNLIDGLEVYNGNLRHDSQNGKADKFAEEHNLKKISGSDFHENEDLARGGIITEKKADSMEELLAVLSEGKYKLIQS